MVDEAGVHVTDDDGVFGRWTIVSHIMDGNAGAFDQDGDRFAP
jgi:hypothetical protein